jgi:hypothetical protein
LGRLLVFDRRLNQFEHVFAPLATMLMKIMIQVASAALHRMTSTASIICTLQKRRPEMPDRVLQFSADFKDEVTAQAAPRSRSLFCGCLRTFLQVLA